MYYTSDIVTKNIFYYIYLITLNLLSRFLSQKTKEIIMMTVPILSVRFFCPKH